MNLPRSNQWVTVMHILVKRSFPVPLLHLSSDNIKPIYNDKETSQLPGGDLVLLSPIYSAKEREVFILKCSLILGPQTLPKDALNPEKILLEISNTPEFS